jgi:hypothetical protein
VTPDAEPGPPGEPAQVAFENLTDRLVPSDAFRVRGEIVNTGGQNLAYVEIAGEFYDAAGELVDMEVTYALLEIVGPGQKAPFEVVLQDAGEEIASYALTARYDTTQVQPLQVDVVGQQAGWSAEGTYDISGDVRNTHDVALPYVQVVATCYDSTGGVVGSGLTYIETGALAPGASEPFAIKVANAPATVSRYELQTLATQEEPE